MKTTLISEWNSIFIVSWNFQSPLIAHGLLALHLKKNASSSFGLIQKQVLSLITRPPIVARGRRTAYAKRFSKSYYQLGLRQVGTPGQQQPQGGCHLTTHPWPLLGIMSTQHLLARTFSFLWLHVFLSTCSYIAIGRSFHGYQRKQGRPPPTPPQQQRFPRKLQKLHNHPENCAAPRLCQYPEPQVSSSQNCSSKK